MDDLERQRLGGQLDLRMIIRKLVVVSPKFMV